MVDVVETAADISLDEPSCPGEVGLEFRQGSMTAPSWSKTMRTATKARLIVGFEDHPQHDYDHNSKKGYKKNHVDKAMIKVAQRIEKQKDAHKAAVEDLKAVLDNLSDTFRQMLQTLGKQINIPVFDEGIQANPVDIAAHGVQHARERGLNPVIVDTAGHLQIDEPVAELVTDLVPLGHRRERRRGGALHEVVGDLVVPVDIPL